MKKRLLSLLLALLLVLSLVPVSAETVTQETPAPTQEPQAEAPAQPEEEQAEPIVENPAPAMTEGEPSAILTDGEWALWAMPKYTAKALQTPADIVFTTGGTVKKNDSEVPGTFSVNTTTAGTDKLKGGQQEIPVIFTPTAGGETWSFSLPMDVALYTFDDAGFEFKESTQLYDTLTYNAKKQVLSTLPTPAKPQKKYDDSTTIWWQWNYQLTSSNATIDDLSDENWNDWDGHLAKDAGSYKVWYKAVPAPDCPWKDYMGESQIYCTNTITINPKTIDNNDTISFSWKLNPEETYFNEKTSFSYTGKEIKPYFMIKVNDDNAASGEDTTKFCYNLYKTYENNILPTTTAKVTANIYSGNYRGEVTGYFTITGPDFKSNELPTRVSQEYINDSIVLANAPQKDCGFGGHFLYIVENTKDNSNGANVPKTDDTRWCKLEDAKAKDIGEYYIWYMYVLEGENNQITPISEPAKIMQTSEISRRKITGDDIAYGVNDISDPKYTISFSQDIDLTNIHYNNGNEITPTIAKFHDNILNTDLVQGETGDYTVSYRNNKNAGTGQIVITLSSTSPNYYTFNSDNEIILEFHIQGTPVTIEKMPSVKQSLVYNGTEQELVDNGTITGAHLEYYVLQYAPIKDGVEYNPTDPISCLDFENSEVLFGSYDEDAETCQTIKGTKAGVYLYLADVVENDGSYDFKAKFEFLEEKGEERTPAENQLYEKYNELYLFAYGNIVYIQPKPVDENFSVVMANNEVIVKDSSTTLTCGQDYTVGTEWKDNALYIVVTFKGNYTGELKQIAPTNIKVLTGNNTFSDNLQTVLNQAAKSDDPKDKEIKVLNNISDEEYISVKAGVTLDLNGHNITGVDLFYVTGNVIDTATETKGIVLANDYMIGKAETYLPLHNGSGFSFYNVGVWDNYDEKDKKYQFALKIASPDYELVRTLIGRTANSIAASGIKATATFTWEKDGNTHTQTVVYNDAQVLDVFSHDNYGFLLGISGINDIESEITLSFHFVATHNGYDIASITGQTFTINKKDEEA